jgi:hypothetical protein
MRRMCSAAIIYNSDNKRALGFQASAFLRQIENPCRIAAMPKKAVFQAFLTFFWKHYRFEILDSSDKLAGGSKFRQLRKTPTRAGQFLDDAMCASRNRRCPLNARCAIYTLGFLRHVAEE